MNEEYTEKSGGFVKFLLILFLVGLGCFIFWSIRVHDENGKESKFAVSSSQEVADPATTARTITEAEWTAIDKELKQLRKEMTQLRNELNQLKQATKAPAKTTTQTTTKPAATTAKANTADITLESYSHDLYGRTARLSFKNNTNDEVTSITGRMIYYDMSGNMLDYRDFTKSTAIDPSMVKSVDIEGFRTSDDYVYYKNKYADLGVKYKVKFQLKSYKTK